jgi:hypothetical protein
MRVVDQRISSHYESAAACLAYSNEQGIYDTLVSLRRSGSESGAHVSIPLARRKVHIVAHQNHVSSDSRSGSFSLQSASRHGSSALH